MGAGELRLKNLVYDTYGNIVEITVIDDTVNWCKPIALTEEWLLRLGFEIKGENIKHSFIGENPVTFDWMIVLTNCGDYWFYKNAHHKIKCVHQLQNLYFALTETELVARLN